MSIFHYMCDKYHLLGQVAGRAFLLTGSIDLGHYSFSSDQSSPEQTGFGLGGGGESPGGVNLLFSLHMAVDLDFDVCSSSIKFMCFCELNTYNRLRASGFEWGLKGNFQWLSVGSASGTFS